MKKILFLFSLLISFSNYAQSLFDKYEDFDQVSSVVVTNEMFKLLKEIEPEGAEAKEEIGVLSDLTGLKVFSTEDAQTQTQMINDANQYANSKKMTELMRINDQDNNVKFYIVKGNQPHIAKELVMILKSKNPQNPQSVIMLVTGNIDLKKLSKLNKKVKIIDSKYLKEVEEKQGN